MMKSAFLCSLLFLASCSFLSNKEPETGMQGRARLYQEGLRYMSHHQYQEALEKFEEVLKKEAVGPEVTGSLFQSALALQGLERWEESLLRLRKYISLQDINPFQATAFYRMGLAYEAIGQEPKALAAFQDAMKREKNLTEETRVEIQSRLANVYSRLGQSSEAEYWYKKSEENFLKLRKKFGNRRPPWLAETLYNMGRVLLRKIHVESFAFDLRPIERSQEWLLKAIRVEDQKYSPLAAQELVEVYQSALEAINSVPLDNQDQDKIRSLKDQQDKKIEMSTQLYQLIAKLMLDRGYDFDYETNAEKKTFLAITEIKKSLELILRSRPVNQGLTPEARRREGLKRKGQNSPPPSLPPKKPVEIDPNLRK